MSAYWIDLHKSFCRIQQHLVGAQSLLSTEVFASTGDTASTWYDDSSLAHGLNQLRERILEELLLLERRLMEQSVRAATARQALVMMAVYFDERIRAELAHDPLLGWRSLYQSLTDGQDDGADAFYAQVEQLTQTSDPETLVCELSYYVLALGYRGGLEPNGARHLDYQMRLRSKIKTRPPTQLEVVRTPDILKQPATGARYYVMAVVGLVLLVPALSVVSYLRWAW